uniref:Uncharacterized protein n=1 Tax=Oryza brachyantha TaxID=4533 RepID=J3MU76_ORYBR
MPSPVGSDSAFCDPVSATSTPHSSMRKSTAHIDDTPSTSSSAGCLCLSERAIDRSPCVRDQGKVHQDSFVRSGGARRRGVWLVTEELADGGEIVGDAGGGLVVDDADGLDGVGRVAAELVVERGEVGALAPVALHHVHLEVEALLLVDPQQAELPDQERHDAVPRRQRVRQRALPRPRPCIHRAPPLRLSRRPPPWTAPRRDEASARYRWWGRGRGCRWWS